ncbi:hypothetical protein [Moraxella catarrhalis]|uniref:hypothetical protein n=1 Tax=Moraxella catarrhalis TaxID=480 RepID=UPI0018839CAF|nr:hypothetical protein [Moraxella catarrhalis]
MTYWINALLLFDWAVFGMTDIVNRYQANTPFDRVDRVIFRLYHKFMRTLKGFDGGFWA